MKGASLAGSRFARETIRSKRSDSCQQIPGRIPFFVEPAHPSEPLGFAGTAGRKHLNREAVSTDQAVALTRILVIDDDAAVGKMIAHILRMAHDVVIEASPRSALARLGTDRRFHLILCDITMPELSGIQVYDCLLYTSPSPRD